MALEFTDLEYRVRNVRTGNVVAAFPNSTDARRYVQFLMTDRGYSLPTYEIETTNGADFDTAKATGSAS